MKVLSFSLASSYKPCKIIIQFRRSFWGWLSSAPLVVSTFTDHHTFWSEMPVSGVSVTCDAETSKFLDMLRLELETGVNELPSQMRKAFNQLPIRSISR
jgi:hypothetical protein